MALTREQIQTAFENTLGREASQSDEDSFFAVSQSGALTNTQIYVTIADSQEADLNADPVVRFYQAAFGRVPDQSGLDNATDYVRVNGATAETYLNLANQFVQSAEFQARFGAGTGVDAAYVQALFTTILGRQASAAEIDAYVSGANGYTTRGGVLYAVAQSSEAIGLTETAVDGFLNNAAQGTAVYTGTLFTAENGQPNAPGASGQTYVLQTGTDVVPGTGGNDTINGLIDPSTGGITTFTADDSIDGGAGTDRFNILVSGSSGLVTEVPLYGVKNVEQFFVQNANSGATVEFDAGRITGEQQVWNDRSEGQGAGVDILNLAAGATVGVRGNGSIEVSKTSFTYASATDAVTIAIDGGVKANGLTSAGDIQRLQSGTAAVTIASTGADNTLGTIDLDNAGANIKSVTINATTDLSASLDSSDYAAGASLTLGGPGAVALRGSLSGNITTINAAGNAGGVDLQADNAAALTFTGGSGDDILELGATLNASDTIDGGAGTDTVRIIAGNISSAGNAVLAGINKLANVEQVEFIGTGVTLNDDAITGSTVSELILSTDGDDVVTNAGARTYAFSENNDGDASFTTKSGVTTLNLEVVADSSGSVGAGVVTASGATTVNIALSGDQSEYANGFEQLNVASGTTINVTGSNDFEIGGIKAVDGTAFATTAGVTVNAGTLTGNLTVAGSAGADTITGGAGNDILVGTAGPSVAAADAVAEVQAFKINSGATANGTIGINGQSYSVDANDTVDAIGARIVATALDQNSNVASVTYDDQADTITLTYKASAGNVSDVPNLNSNATGVTFGPVTVVTQGAAAIAASQYSAAAAPAGDVLTGGGGSDTFVFANNSTSLTIVPTITDLKLGTSSDGDILSFQQAGGTGVAGAGVTVTTLTGAQQNAINSAATLANAVDGLLADATLGAAGTVTQFTYGTDTYILHSGDSAAANAAFTGTDHLVKVTGVTGTLDASAVVLFAGQP